MSNCTFYLDVRKIFKCGRYFGSSLTRRYTRWCFVAGYIGMLMCILWAGLVHPFIYSDHAISVKFLTAFVYSQCGCANTLICF